MAHNSEAARSRAEQFFKKTATQPELVTSRQTAEDVAAREKIARLRALRLAKDGAPPPR